MPSTGSILTLSLNTFIRYYALDRSKLVGEVGRRMQQPGGYEFYRLLGEAVKAKIKNSSEDEINFILGSTNNPSEESYNKSAYRSFMHKYGNKRGICLFEKKGRVKLCDGDLTVLISPHFAIESKSGVSVYNIWAPQNPILDRSRAAVGVYLMQRAFRKSAANYHYKMFDAVESKTYSAVNNTTRQAILDVANNIVDLAKSS